MTGPTAEQWRRAAYELRQHAMKFDDLADKAEDEAEAEIEAERRHVVPLTELPAPIEQLVALWDFVHAEPHNDDSDMIRFDHLRSVKP